MEPKSNRNTIHNQELSSLDESSSEELSSPPNIFMAPDMSTFSSFFTGSGSASASASPPSPPVFPPAPPPPPPKEILYTYSIPPLIT